MRPCGLDQNRLIAGPRAAVAGGARELLEVHWWNTTVLGHRRSQPTGYRRFVVVPREVTAPAGRSGHPEIVRNIGLTFVPANDPVVDPIAVTINTFQAGCQVNILIAGPLLSVLVRKIHTRVTKIAPIGWCFSQDVKENLLLVIERIRSIRDAGRYLFGV